MVLTIIDKLNEQVVYVETGELDSNSRKTLHNWYPDCWYRWVYQDDI
jgi:hypothetical protein